MTAKYYQELKQVGKCPVCRHHTGYYYWPAIEPGKMERFEFPLYQRSYPGKKGHISPRCENCFDKEVKNGQETPMDR